MLVSAVRQLPKNTQSVPLGSMTFARNGERPASSPQSNNGTVRNRNSNPTNKKFRQLVADHPDATLAEFCEKLSDRVSVSTTTLCDFLRHLKITRKKRLSLRPNGTEKMSSKNEKSGRNSKKSSTSKGSFSLMKPGRKQT